MSRLDVYGFLGAAVGFFVGMIGHELSHAWTAVKLGDPTPRMMGRLTLNPKAHSDLIGTVILPGIFLISILFKANFGFLFGYAKPVTIHPGRLRNPKRDAVVVALAGPIFNLVVVILAGFAFRNVTGFNPRLVLLWIGVINTYLFIINILPIPPLDGSLVVIRFLSPMAAARYEAAGQYLLLFLIAMFLIFSGVIENIAAAIYEPIYGIPRLIG